MRTIKWIALPLLLGTVVVFIFSDAFSIPALTSNDKNNQRSIPPGASNGIAASPNYRMDSIVGELLGSTLTSTSYVHHPGSQYLLSWPGTITSLSALTGDNPNEIRITWIAPGSDGTVDQASSYLIKYRISGPFLTDSDFEDSFNTYLSTRLPKAPGAFESHVLTGLSAGPTYYFAVVAQDSFTVRGYLSNGASSFAYGPPDLEPPDQISDLTALSGDADGRIYLAWTSPGDDAASGSLDVGRYRVHGSTANFPMLSSTHSAAAFGAADFDFEFATNAVNPGVSVGYSADGLNPGTTYFFGVLARDDSNNWNTFTRPAIYNRLSSAPATDLPLAEPSAAIVAAISTRSFTVSWTLPPAPSGKDDRYAYRLYTATSAFTSSTQSWVRLSSEVAHPLASAATAQLDVNTTYFYALTAVDSGTITSGLFSTALESAIITIYSTATLSDVPASVQISEANRSSVTVSWTQGGNPQSPPTQYELWTSLDPGFAAYTSSVTNLLSASTAALSLNTTYYFQVRSLNRGGHPGAFAGSVSTVTQSLAPGVSGFQVYTTSVAVTLSPNFNPAGTIVEISSGGFTASSSSAGALSASEVSLTLGNLTPNTTYMIQARTRNFQLIPSTNTAVINSSATLPAIPSAFDFVTPPAVINFTSITMRWSPDGNPLSPPTSYEMQVSTWSGFAGAVTSSITFNVFASTLGLTSDATYYFRARSFGIGNSASPFSGIVSTFTRDNLPPAALTSLSALTGDNPGEIKISWIAPGDNGTIGQAVYYEIRRAVPPIDWSSNFNGAVLITNSMPAGESGSLEQYTVGSLASGTTYAFAVKAIDEAGNYATLSNGATAWAKQTDNSQIYYMGVNSVTNPASAKGLVGSPGGSSNTTTRITPTTVNNYYVLRPLIALTDGGVAGLPSATTTYGWLYDTSLAGLTVESGNWTLNITYRSSNINLVGELWYRLNRVTVTSQDTALKSALTQGTNGWVQWGSGNLTATTAFLTTTTVIQVAQTYFESDDRLMLEMAVRPTNGVSGTRRFEFQIDNTSSVIRTSNIADSMAPSQVTCLTALNAGLSEGEIRIEWLAPGDDGTYGQASAYDIRYTNDPAFNWASNFDAAPIWKSARAAGGAYGTFESDLVTSTGLDGGTTYYFSLRSYDDVGNATLSNAATQWAMVDRIPPRNISDLTALISGSEASVNLEWTAPGDNAATGPLVAGSSYTIRASTVSFAYYSSTLGALAPYDVTVAIATSGVSPGSRQGYQMTGLAPGTTWYFGIYSSDDNRNTAVWNKAGSFNVKNSTPALDLPLPAPTAPNVTSVSSTSANVSWTLPPAPANFDDRSLYRLYSATASFTVPSDGWVMMSSEVSHPIAQATTAQIHPNRLYYFRASALDLGDQGAGIYSAALESNLSSLISTYTLSEVPGGLQHSEVNLSSISASWTRANNPLPPLTTYQVLMSTSSDFVPATSSTTFSLSAATASLMINTTYYFKVRSVNPLGLPSDYTPLISTPTLASTVTLNAPQWASADVGISVSTARWNSNGNPGGTLYHVEFATSADFGGAVTSSDTYAVQATTSGLLGGTTMVFRVQAVNHQKRSSNFVASVATATLPGTVTLNNPNWASADVGFYAATAVWNAGTNSPGVTYHVEFATSSNFAGAVTITSTDTASLSVSTAGLLGSTTVAFRVRAVSPQGQAGAYAASASTSTLAEAGVFANFLASDITSSSQIVRWTAPGNNTRTLYNIRISTWSDFSAYTTSQTYILQVATAGLKPNTTYYYRGLAVNNLGIQSPFALDIASPTRANPPATAASTFTSVTPNDITAQWGNNGNPGVTIYNVYIATVSSFSSAAITTTTVNTVNVTTSNVSENTSYFFRVSAVSHQGFESAAVPIGSTLTPVSTDFSPPRNISDLTALTGTIDGRIQVNWTSPGDDGNSGTLNNGRYRIRYSTSNFAHFSSTYADLSGLSATIGLGDVFITTTGVAPGTRVGAFVDGLNPGTTYYSSVIARDDSSNWSFFTRGGPVNRLSSGPARDLVLAAPASVALVSVSSTDARVSWTAPSAPANIDDRASYRLYSATSSFASVVSSWVRLSSTVAHPLAAATSAQLTPNTSYMFNVTAVDLGDQGSGLFSAALESALAGVSVTTFTRAEVPGMLSVVSADASSMTLTWLTGSNPLTPPTSYQIQISTDAGFGALSSSLTFRVDTTTRTLLPNTTYFARARAYSRVGLPTEFNAAFATATLASSVTLNAPNWAPADLGISISTARWNANGNPSYTLYRVQYATSGSFSGAVTSSDTYSLFSSTSGLLGNTTIGYRVASVNVNGRLGPYIFSQSTATLAASPLEGFPTSFFTVQYTSVSLRWNGGANTSFTEYQLEISTAADFSGASDALSGWGYFAFATHTFTSLAAETTYYAQIQARNSRLVKSAFTYLGTTVTLDNAPPGAVTSMTSLTGATEGIISLGWVAPGDNSYLGPLGTGSRFHIASTTVLGSAQNPAFWTSAVRDNAQVQIATSNVFPGTTQYTTLTGLTGGVTYYFRVWTQDESGNWSGGLSQGATAWAQQDLTAPNAATDLNAVNGSTIGMVAVNLSWTMPGDDGLSGNIVGGTVTVKFQSEAQGGAITAGNFNAAVSTYNFYHSSASGTAFTVPVTGLISETSYYFAVKIRDERGNISSISNTTFTVSPDTVAPSAVTSLTALTGADTGEIILRWIAPGDNGTIGQGYRYEIRRAVPPIDWPANFNNAALVTNTLAAGPPGVLEEFTAGGLTAGATYSFAVKAVDESGNQAQLSNGATMWAALPNDTTYFYLRNISVTNPLEAKALATGPGSGSNTTTRVTPATGNDNTYYVLKPLVTATGNGAASLPSATTTFGWIYDASLAGLTVQGGTWTLKGRYEMSATGLTGNLYYRINRVTVTSTSTTIRSFLTQGTDGWVQWGSGPFPNFTTLTTTVAFASISQTYFESGERLMVEYAFQPTGSNSARRFHWEVNDTSDVIRTTNINDIVPPRIITNLVAFGTSAYLNEGQVRLEWTAPGDDGSVGQVFYYDVRYSNDSNFDWTNNFNAASIWLSQRASGGAAEYAETEFIAATGLIGGDTYYFAIRSNDDAGNSSLSNVATAQAGFDEVAVVVVGTNTYNFGLVDIGASIVSASSFTLKNVGNVLQDYKLRATTMTTDSPWSLDVSSGTDKLILSGGFSESPPSLNDFGTEDVILYGNQFADNARYAIGPSSGTTVPWNDLRHLWLKLNMPMLTSTTDVQRIQITVTGTKSP